MYEISESPHGCGQLCIQIYAPDHSRDREIFFLRQAVSINWSDSPFYQKKLKASPFIQGYNKEDGWILVEFWGGSKSEIKKYVKFLNEELEKELDWQSNFFLERCGTTAKRRNSA